MMQWLTNSWYQPHHPLRWLLSPLSGIYRLIISIRYRLYCSGILRSEHLPVPVIVVGNITVGGTGKTPFVIWLTQQLKHAGYHPGIVSRGYGGQAKHYPQLVTTESNPVDVGDEPVILARRSQSPVVVDLVKVRGAKYLVAQHDCDVIVTDDGLQHYALQRDIEIVIVDGQRDYGNGACLPAGPLREPLSRLHRVDYVIYNGGPTGSQSYQMQLTQHAAINLHDPAVHKPLVWFKQDKVHAVAGIGNPQRFFDQLQQQGIKAEPHVFADHHPYQPSDLQFDDEAQVLMTEKDAVKCQSFATKNMWYVPITVTIDESLPHHILKKLRNLSDG